MVLWSKLDRLTWKTATKLEVELLQHFGLAYRNYLRQTRIVVNGKTAEPVDPLFTTPGYRFYDFGGQRANALPFARVHGQGRQRQKPARADSGCRTCRPVSCLRTRPRRPQLKTRTPDSTSARTTGA